MNSRRSCKSPLWRFAVIVLVQALSPAPAAEATGGPCDSQAWADTKCCREGAEIGAVSEDTLTVTDCDSTTVEGTNVVQMEWHHSTLREGNHALRRIFLFSYCINPTNTSSAPSMSTLLYSSARSHLTSSTTVSHPVASACSYFGCYEGNFGNNLYTFSEVSCTPTPTTSSGLPDAVSLTSVLYAGEMTTESELMMSVPASLVGGQLTPSPTSLLGLVSPQQGGTQSSLGQALASSQTTEPAGKSTVDRVKETSSFLLTPAPSAPTPSPSTETAGAHTASLWPWLLGVPLLVMAVTVTATISCIIVARACITRSRDFPRVMKGLSWYADPWTGNVQPVVEDDLPTDLLKDLDRHSLHSVQTLYDYIVLDQKVTGDLDKLVTEHLPESLPSLPLATSGEREDESAVIFDSSRQTSSSSGVSSMCPSDVTTDASSSACTSSQSYVTYGSLCTLIPKQARSHADEEQATKSNTDGEDGELATKSNTNDSHDSCHTSS